MIDMDMGQEDVVEPLDLFLLELGKEVRNCRQGSRIDQKGQFFTLIEPAADELAKALERWLVKVDAAEDCGRHVLYSGGWPLVFSDSSVSSLHCRTMSFSQAISSGSNCF